MGKRAGKGDQALPPVNPNSDSYGSLGCQPSRNCLMNTSLPLARWEGSTTNVILEEAPEVWRS